MLECIYKFFFILFQQSLHTIGLELSLFFMYYLLDEKQKAYISYMHDFNLQRFEREKVYTRDNYIIKVCTSLPAIFMTGVHPPSPHPKFPMWKKTDKGWESTRRVLTPFSLDLLNQKGKKKNTTNNENNDGEIKPELMRITIIATTVAMKMTMGKKVSDNNNNDSTNEQMKSWSFRRQYLRNIKH